MHGKIGVGQGSFKALPRPPASSESSQYLSTLVRAIEQNQAQLPAIVGFLNLFSKHYFVYKNGDPGLLFNAEYNAHDDEFNRVEPGKPAFWIDFRISDNIPGDDQKGIVFWRAVPGTNPVGAFAAANGWLKSLALNIDGTLE